MDKLRLLAGNDIPFLGARVNVHQPTLKEIAYIGEHQFFIGIGFLNFSKDLLDPKDKSNLSNYSDFDILMSIMVKPKDAKTRKTVSAARSVLTLIFPLYQVEVRSPSIVLKKDGAEFVINNDNYVEFKNILDNMFCLTSKNSAEKYNPSGDMASRIAAKLEARHKKLAELSGKALDPNNISILNRYASILAVGTQKPFSVLMQYTLYQLYDEFQRFQLKMQWDAYVSARMAGAKDLEEVDNWMIDLADQGKNKNKNKK